MLITFGFSQQERSRRFGLFKKIDSCAFFSFFLVFLFRLLSATRKNRNPVLINWVCLKNNENYERAGNSLTIKAATSLNWKKLV
jgi:hypothetical protein